jgi:hypothetical protein
MKDIMLVDTAMKNDKIILTIDKEAIKFYKNISHTLPYLGEILWVNPLIDTDKILKWLESEMKTNS